MPVKFPNTWWRIAVETSAVFACLLALASPTRSQTIPSTDSEWTHVEQLRQQLAGNVPKGTNEVEFSTPIKRELHGAASQFAASHPDDPHAWDARLLELKTIVFPTPVVERKEVFRQQEDLLKSILSSPQAPEPIKQQAERTLISQHLDHLDLIDTPEQAAALEARIVAYIQRHPDDQKANALQVRRLDLLQKADPKKAADLLATLANSDDLKVAAAAHGRQELQTLEGTPLDWKFTAVDGREVDLSQWRGKIVLVDFWATWCPDCLRELPDVLAAYHQDHDKGLEIVGVSLDTDQEALVSFLKKRHIPWPQQFDGKGWEAGAATKYGVRGIPEMWLVDREGKVVATGVHGSQLETKLRPLLNP